MVFFCEYSLQFTVVNNFEKKLQFRSVTWQWICLGYFFRFTFIIDIFLLLTCLNINGTSAVHKNVCLTSGIPQDCLLCRLDVLVNFGQIFALFLDTFIVDFEYYLFIVNATL